MKQMKFLVLVYFVLLNINLLFGQERLFDSILNKVERNIDKNYYTDSIFAFRYSEYITNDSTKNFEKVVCIEYFPTPMWSIDSKFYNRKFGFNNSIFPLRTIGHLISAKLYKKGEKNNFGFTIPHRFGSSFSLINIEGNFHSTLSSFVLNNRTKREDSKKNNHDTNLPNKTNIHSFDINNNFRNQKNKISVDYGDINNKKASNNNSVSANNLPEKITITSTPIYTMIDESTAYIIDNVVYDDTDCYKLTMIIKTSFIYTEFERQRFENTVLNEYTNIILQQHLTEQKKNEYRQLVEYWANGENITSQTYIIAKKNFAILSFLREIKQQNYKGEWFEIEKITEKYKEGQNKKHYQTYYARLVRNYFGSSPNIDNLLTLVVRTSLERNFSLDNTTIIPRKIKLSYEDFCERVDELDDIMLLDWNNFENNRDR